MKKKITNLAVDLLLITLAFWATDMTVMHVTHSESMWAELGVYVVFYAIVFGAKRGIIYLWKKDDSVNSD